MNDNGAVLIVGSYGVVGSQVAEVIRQRYPSLPLILAGRNPAKAQALVNELTNATTTILDVDHPNPLNGRKPRAILAVVNDPFDHLLMDAVHGGIPYLDITRWTERLGGCFACFWRSVMRTCDAVFGMDGWDWCRFCCCGVPSIAGH